MALAAARLTHILINYVHNYQTLLDDPTLQIILLLAFTGTRTHILKAPAKTFTATGKLSVTSSSANKLTVNNIKAQKGYAVTAYAKQRGLTMDTVHTIGDNLNDARHIKMAKYGVAMDYAIPTITALDWDTTKTNSTNGVAAAIRKAIRVNKATHSNATF